MTEKKLIPMSFDLIFKKMFGDNEHKERTASLLSVLLGIPYDDLVDNIELLPTEKKLRNKKDKRQYQDVIVKIILSVNKRVSLEMNMNYDNVNKNRNIQYLTGIFYNQLKNTDNYNLLEPCIQINFNTVYTDKKNKVLFDKYSLKNEFGYELTDKIKIYNLNIAECYEILYNDDINKYEEGLRNIIRYGVMMMETDYKKLKNMLEEFKMKDNLKDDILDTMEEYSEDEEIGLWYDAEEERRRLFEGSLEEAKEQAKKEAIEEGKRETAKNMLKDNIDIDKITKYTGLSEEEIKKLA